MKKSIFIFLFLLNINGFAKSWQVSNITPTADFSSLIFAHAQAQNGDTLFVEGSGNPYDGVTLTKKLILIGPGYFLTENPNTHYNKRPALIRSNIIFEKGSLGSEIIGFELRSHGADIAIRDNNITIKRNRLDHVYFSHPTGPATFSNILITQNYIEGNIAEIHHWLNADQLILNNLIVSYNFVGAIILEKLNDGSAMSALFENNIVNDHFQCYSSIIRNNIHIKSSTYNAYYIFEKKRFNDIYNNIFTFNSTADLVNFQQGTNNQWLINRSIIFVGLPNNSTDGQWQLLTNSPARNAGTDGSDCGIFGGATPYQLSGLPPVPVVYDIIGPDLQTGKVTVKARAIK